MDSFGLSTTAEKPQAISQLTFHIALHKLETYLGMTGPLRRYVSHYAQFSESFQQRKTLILRSYAMEGNARSLSRCKAIQSDLPNVVSLPADRFMRIDLKLEKFIGEGKTWPLPSQATITQDKGLDDGESTGVKKNRTDADDDSFGKTRRVRVKREPLDNNTIETLPLTDSGLVLSGELGPHRWRTCYQVTMVEPQVVTIYRPPDHDSKDPLSI